uniref:PDZ domain-containing protein n=1 Tax=Heterorhabditis bacteriophora TaxID=37862 RepID=A0A1I7X8J4_HETBA
MGEMASSSAKTLEIEIQMEEGEPLGATPNDKLIITKIQSETISDGKLKIGDQVVKVNGRNISDQNSFFKALRYAPPLARLTVIRLIQRRDGFAYFVGLFFACIHETLCSCLILTYFQLAKIEWQQNGPKLGLGIKHFQNRVLVSRCDPGSLVCSQLQVGDHIIDIDGFPVTDKDVARDLLIKALQTRGKVSTVIERPETTEAKHWTQQALITQPPSIQMNSDVRAIAARERNKLKEMKPTPKSILGRSNSNRRVMINDEIAHNIIASDNEGRQLRSVKK